MRVLLVKSRSLRFKAKGRTPPLGIMYLAAYLRRHLSAEVAGFDVELARDPEAEMRKVIAAFRPDLVGISALTCEGRTMHALAGAAKLHDPRCPVVVGGPYPSSDPETTLGDRNVDVAVIGEGEETLRELAELVRDEGERWREGGSLGGVRGIAYRSPDGETIVTEPRPFVEDLDTLPFPDWDLVDIRHFWKTRSMSSIGIRPYLPLFTSRGCPYRCVFCHQLFGRRFRARSAESVLGEAREIRRRYAVEDFEILDDAANLDAGRLNRILEGLLEGGRRTRVHFPNGIRTDTLEEETIALLGRAGPGEVSIGVETASPRLQKLIRKNLDLQKVWDNIERMDRRGIATRGLFMMGFPTETREELQATVDYACRSALSLALFFTINPYPGTEMHEMFRRHGRLPEDVRAADHEFFGSPFNASDVPDAAFRRLYKRAYLRFYGDPRRILRILRRRPFYRDIPLRVVSLLRNTTSFRRQERSR